MGAVARGAMRETGPWDGSSKLDSAIGPCGGLSKRLIPGRPRASRRVGSSNAAFVGDEVTDRFCLLGSADEHVAKLHELADAGVDQFNFYLMNGDEETQVDAYGKDVIPAFR